MPITGAAWKWTCMALRLPPAASSGPTRLDESPGGLARSQFYVSAETDLPDDRQPGQTSLAAAANDHARPRRKAEANRAAPIRGRTPRPDTQPVEVSWKMSGSTDLPA